GGKGPVVPGPDGTLRPTLLFCAWLAWSRFRVVLPVWDRTLPTLIACLDATLRRIGGAPVYALTDNEKTVTVEHVAGVPVRHPEIVAVGRHYGMTVHTCVPYDPESKGGSEATVRVAKAELVPAEEIACLDATLRRIGGAPVYALTDNEKTVTVEHVAGVPVRHPEIVAVGRHYGMTVHTCVPYDPESKGGSEATVRVAKADLVPAEANLLEQYRSFAQLAAACD